MNGFRDRALRGEGSAREGGAAAEGEASGLRRRNCRAPDSGSHKRDISANNVLFTLIPAASLTAPIVVT